MQWCYWMLLKFTISDSFQYFRKKPCKLWKLPNQSPRKRLCWKDQQKREMLGKLRRSCSNRGLFRPFQSPRRNWCLPGSKDLAAWKENFLLLIGHPVGSNLSPPVRGACPLLRNSLLRKLGPNPRWNQFESKDCYISNIDFLCFLHFAGSKSLWEFRIFPRDWWGTITLKSTWEQRRTDIACHLSPKTGAPQNRSHHLRLWLQHNWRYFKKGFPTFR